MAVELRCPDCRARLRLAEYPDPGAEVECPNCQTVFPAPDPDTGEVPDDRPRKKPEAAEPAPKPKPKPKPAAKGAAGPKKRKVKKKTTNKTLLYVLIGGGVAFVALLGGALFWFFNRQSAAVEMMEYLPEDCWTASGGNIGHFQKYPELFQKVESLYSTKPFTGCVAALGTALGQKPEEFLDYVVTGSAKGGAYAVVLRTKKDFDPEALAKLPGARETKVEGGKYYAATLPDGNGVKVFAPTTRLAVFAASSVSDGTLRGMMKKNAGSDRTLPARAGKLATQSARGTAWIFFMLEAGDKPAARSDTANASDQGAALQAHAVELLTNAKGAGGKVSVGSGSVRFEALILYPDSDAAGTQYQKFRDSSLAKGDEEEPPKWWKDLKREVGNKKIETELLSNVGAAKSGELFIYKSQVPTKTMMEGVQGMGAKMLAITGVSSIGGGGGGAAFQGGPQANPGGAPGGGPPAGGPPGGQRRPGGGP